MPKSMQHAIWALDSFIIEIMIYFIKFKGRFAIVTKVWDIFAIIKNTRDISTYFKGIYNIFP